MPQLDVKLVEKVAKEFSEPGEEFLVDSFKEICKFLEQNPERLSLSATKAEKEKGFVPSVYEEATLQKLARKHFKGYRKSDVPVQPKTIPDPAVSKVLSATFGYSQSKVDTIKVEHQQSMRSENSVGGLLERYIDSQVRDHGWYWCCGGFVRAIDFLNKDGNSWQAFQIKNRDNSENSSSSAIRNGTEIQKWFRSFSRDTERSRSLNYVNWDNLPKKLKEKGLSEEGFHSFIESYIKENK